MNPQSDAARFHEEWARTENAVRDRCAASLTRLGMSPPALAYVLGLKAYHRLPYLFALWVRDEEKRRHIAVYLCVHCVGTKLLDDIVDADQPYSPVDQVLGAHLMHEAVSSLCRLADPLAILDVCDTDHLALWQGMIREMRHPADSFATWMEHTRIKCGLLFASYITLACRAGRADEAITAGRTFGDAFGNLIQIADDLGDYSRLGERGGNLGHLLATGAVAPHIVRGEIRDSLQRALAALKEQPTIYDIAPIVEAKADDAARKLDELCERLGAPA